VTDQQEAVWRAYQVHHPRLKRGPTGGEKRRIVWAIREVRKIRGLPSTAEGVSEATSAVVEIIDHIHLGPDTAFYRGENDQGRKHLGLESPILKTEKFGNRLDCATAWVARGRPRHGPRPRERPGRRLPPASAEDVLRRLAKDELAQPNALFQLPSAPIEDPAPQPHPFDQEDQWLP
jgi:hypothetical protein